MFELAKEYFGDADRFDVLIDLHKEVEDLEMQVPFFSHKTYQFVEKECHSIIDQLIKDAA